MYYHAHAYDWNGEIKGKRYKPGDKIYKDGKFESISTVYLVIVDGPTPNQVKADKEAEISRKSACKSMVVEDLRLWTKYYKGNKALECQKAEELVAKGFHLQAGLEVINQAKKTFKGVNDKKYRFYEELLNTYLYSKSKDYIVRRAQEIRFGKRFYP
jgi:hypothetical protein